MPIVLDPHEAAAYHERNTEPGSFLDMLSAAGYRAAVAGIRLGVFAALRPAPLPAAELAADLGTDERGTRLLCDLLASTGYLSCEDGRFANTPLATAWLAEGAAGYALVELFWQRVIFQLWDDIEASVRTGRPAADFYAWLAEHPDLAEQFQTMLSRHAAVISDEVTSLVPVPTDRPASVLDVGGGHATYAVALCRRHPSLRATVLDLQAALVAGREAVTAADLTDRIELRLGDHRRDDLGTGHDVVLLFNVLHGRDASANQQLLVRVADALGEDGAVVVLEHDLQPPPGAGRSAGAFLNTFGFNLFHGEGGQVYRLDELTGLLAAASLGSVTTRRLASSPLQHLLIARRG
ncbi:MAG TPA: methyltransferase [Pseudonocardiaceae bacterium]|nr:methyltransferase [Pseudonocardiaceae bacterium]